MSDGQTFSVIKRDGRKELFDVDKLTKCLDRLSYGLDKTYLELDFIAKSVANGIYDEVTTAQISALASEMSASRIIRHYSHSLLAARLSIALLHKNTHDKFSDVVKALYEHTSEYTGESFPLVSESFYNIVMNHMDTFDSHVIDSNDFEYEYFGLKTLERAYLLRINGRIVERPQYMLMRVAVGIHGSNISEVLETYKLMTEKYFTHASPTMFNAGTNMPQLSSCFLLGMMEDSIDGIYQTLRRCANISKSAGGIGLHVHNIRSTGSFIAGTNGTSNGLVPMLRVFNETARYVDQGGNRRPGAIAIYLEPWHADVFDFIDLRKNHGKEDSRARDLFLALWVPDLFMKRVENNEDWCLFSPNEAKGLADVYGEEFEDLYKKYEKEGKQRKTVKAQKLWSAILRAQTETGGPFMVYKDACNRKSNQKNLGTIKSSNLCTEIVEYSSNEEIAVCNLASIALSRFVRYDTDRQIVWYDFKKLHLITKKVVYNLNCVIDVCWYPLEEAKASNKKHRPIAVGVQGLADTFMSLRIPFDSPEAKKLNIQIFETIYHGAVEASIELAKKNGPYSSYQGSPASHGILQFDLWKHTPTDLWDWKSLKKQLHRYGLRNSLLVAPMPTASTSNILGLNECFEPYTSNMYTRRVTSGDFQIVNRFMIDDLIDLGLWDEDMRNEIVKNGGSVQDIARIPQDIKILYKTVWEISQKSLVDMAANRGRFIDQSQSLNIYMSDPTPGKLTSMHFYGWKKGLKTGMYYLRTRAAAAPIQFTVDEERYKVSSKRGSPIPANSGIVKRFRYEECYDSGDEANNSGEISGNDSPQSSLCLSQTSSSTSLDDRESALFCRISYVDNRENCDMCSG